MSIWRPGPRSRAFQYPRSPSNSSPEELVILLPPQQRLTVLNLVSSFLFFLYGFTTYVSLKHMLYILYCLLLPDLLLRFIHGDIQNYISFICIYLYILLLVDISVFSNLLFMCCYRHFIHVMWHKYHIFLYLIKELPVKWYMHIQSN